MKRKILLTLCLSFIVGQIFACTTAIISGKYTKDGRPMIWKVRDTESFNNKLMYFTDGRFPYLGLVNAEDKKGINIWGGYNTSGFAIMNSASFNTNLDKPTKFRDQEGIIMRKALKECKTLEDFEKMLKKLPKPWGLNANFGVIDAEGGCAYYECDNNHFVKYDANDSKIAPHGYIIRSNFSYIGKKDKGIGYIRYQNAVKIFDQADAENNLTAENISSNFSRSLYHSLLGIDYNDVYPNVSKGKYINSGDLIVRNGTASAITIQGVKAGNNPKSTCMWSTISYPLSCVSVPIWLTSKGNLPKLMTGKKKSHAKLADYALALKSKIYPIERSAGYKYMDLSIYQNSINGGIKKDIYEIEEQLFNKARSINKEGISDKDIITYYKWVDEYLEKEYKKRFNL
ncbi:MAG: hypothetical protein N4A32_09090 [Marinifilaceae bacterium]|jgi:hypothetical protein|nr:hypothetical protein [Marinifilaceae bacterium]